MTPVSTCHNSCSACKESDIIFSDEQSLAGGHNHDGPPICEFSVASPDLVSFRASMQEAGAGLEVTWLV